MSFFDRKEDILTLELTQYGKYLISKGLFKPEYYAFFDDNVLYDGRYAQLTESQNEIQDRILETPYLKPQHMHVGLEYISQDGILRPQQKQVEFEKKYSNGLPLGSARFTNNKNASFSLEMKEGQIDSVVQFIDNEDYPDIKIPQITLKDNQYQVKNVTGIDNIPEGYKVAVENVDSEEMIVYKEDNNIIQIVEENTEDIVENFSLEVYKIDNGKETQLKFVNQPTYIKNGILLDKPENEDLENLAKYVTEENVEWYFTVKFDEDIIVLDKSQVSDLYTSDVTDKDKPFGDDC